MKEMACMLVPSLEEMKFTPPSLKEPPKLFNRGLANLAAGTLAEDIEERNDGVLECKESSIEVTLPLNEDIAPLEDDTLCSHLGGFIEGNRSHKGVEIGDTQQMNDTMDILLFDGDRRDKNLEEEGVKTTIGIHVNDSMALSY
ncbi:unnamed protein product [Sphagnum compactum]